MLATCCVCSRSSRSCAYVPCRVPHPHLPPSQSPDPICCILRSHPVCPLFSRNRYAIFCCVRIPYDKPDPVFPQVTTLLGKRGLFFLLTRRMSHTTRPSSALSHMSLHMIALGPMLFAFVGLPSGGAKYRHYCAGGCATLHISRRKHLRWDWIF